MPSICELRHCHGEFYKVLGKTWSTEGGRASNGFFFSLKVFHKWSIAHIQRNVQLSLIWERKRNLPCTSSVLKCLYLLSVGWPELGARISVRYLTQVSGPSREVGTGSGTRTQFWASWYRPQVSQLTIWPLCQMPNPQKIVWRKFSQYPTCTA